MSFDLKVVGAVEQNDHGGIKCSFANSIPPIRKIAMSNLLTASGCSRNKTDSKYVMLMGSRPFQTNTCTYTLNIEHSCTAQQEHIVL